MTSTIGIISLSSGIIGEDFVKHEVDLGVQRLKDLGLNPIFLPHSLKGLDFIKAHHEARAEDLIQAFSDDSIDMILCAIGGDDMILQEMKHILYSLILLFMKRERVSIL